MFKPRVQLLVFLVLTSATLAQSVAQPQFEIIVEHDVMITMRDGVKLACDVYRPAQNGKTAEGKFPVILERTPYGKKTGEPWAKYFVPRGYIGVAQDIRGRYGSEGHWWPYRDDGHVGDETVKGGDERPEPGEKIAAQGTSYRGGPLHALLRATPPYLTTMIP